MMGLIIAIHIIACILLIAIILIQRGRGGGLVESLSGVESMFGTKTTSFLSRTTTVLSIIFFITCLSLAILSARQSRSLMKNTKSPEVPLAVEVITPQEQKVQEEAAKSQAQQESQTTTQEEPKPQETKQESPQG